MGRAFSAWRGAADVDVPPDPSTFASPAPPPNRLALVHRPAAAQSELRIGHVALPRSTPDYHAALVLNMILGGQFISRINLNLREEKGYTYGARTAFEFRRAPGPFVLQASVQSDTTVDAIREAFAEIRRHPRRAARDGRGARDRPRRADPGLPAQFRDRGSDRQRRTSSPCTGCPTITSRRSCRRCSALTAADIMRVAAADIDPSRLLTVIIGDREKVSPLGGDARSGAVSEVTMT